MKKIGIIFAMQEELASLKEKLGIKKETNIYDLIFYEGTINDNEFVLVESGVGKVNSARTTQVLVDNYHPDYIFNIGVAGGIDDNLKVGDIVIGERLVQYDFDISAFLHPVGYVPKVGVYVDSNPYLLNIAKEAINFFEDINYSSGIIATGDKFCTDPVISKNINKDFNALCVEMEGASIAQVAFLNEVPFLVLRSISDCPNNDNKMTYEEFLEYATKKVANLMYEILIKIN